MRRMSGRLGAAVILILSGICLGADLSEGAARVQARLVADTVAVRPGEAFRLGVLIDLAPGWHVYWQNPGESGMATSVKFALPDGYTVGPLQFPTPVAFEQAGVLSYGYSGQVLLYVTVTPPPGDNRSELAIAADVRWLVCDDAQCLPGKASPKLSLPVGNGAATPAAGRGDAELFDRWQARTPADVKASADVAGIEWAADPAAKQATVTITWKDKPGRNVYVFPDADPAVTVAPGDAKAADKRTSQAIAVTVLHGQSPKAAMLPAVLAYTAADGERRGVRTEIPVAAATGAKVAPANEAKNEAPAREPAKN